jgi:hypothetical protein
MRSTISAASRQIFVIDIFVACFRLFLCHETLSALHSGHFKVFTKGNQSDQVKRMEQTDQADFATKR